MDAKHIGIAIVMWTVAAGFALFGMLSIRRGHLRVNRRIITRENNPFAFWFWTIYFLLAATFTFAVPVWKFAH